MSNMGYFEMNGHRFREIDDKPEKPNEYFECMQCGETTAMQARFSPDGGMGAQVGVSNECAGRKPTEGLVKIDGDTAYLLAPSGSVVGVMGAADWLTRRVPFFVSTPEVTMMWVPPESN